MVAEKYIRQAANWLADRFEAAGDTWTAKDYRNGDFDGCEHVIAFAEYLEQQDKAQPTFEQRVEAMKKASVIHVGQHRAEIMVRDYDAALTEIMAQVDPLVEALRPHVADPEQFAAKLRPSLAASGLKIVAEGDA